MLAVYLHAFKRWFSIALYFYFRACTVAQAHLPQLVCSFSKLPPRHRCAHIWHARIFYFSFFALIIFINIYTQQQLMPPIIRLHTYICTLHCCTKSCKRMPKMTQSKNKLISLFVAVIVVDWLSWNSVK